MVLYTTNYNLLLIPFSLALSIDNQFTSDMSTLSHQAGVTRIFMTFTQQTNSLLINQILVFSLTNRVLNHGCLVYMFLLRFSGSKFFEATCCSFPEPRNIMSTR